MEKRKLLVVQVAGLGPAQARHIGRIAALPAFQPLAPVFPAVTCAAQASFRTAAPPTEHGLVGNGFFFRELGRPLFWEQSAALVQGPRIWEPLRAAGRRGGLLFWQQSLGESADLVLSPKPVHRHHGGMIQDCYSRPADLYAQLVAAIGRPFNLMRYWGPLASCQAGAWITAATQFIMRRPDLAPDLLLTYIPNLDYDLQRRGPDGGRAVFQSLEKTARQLSNLWKTAEDTGYEALLFGDYAIEAVTRGPVFPNRTLRAAGLFQTRPVKGMAYPDFFASRAFTVADHQVAQVYVRDPADVPKARAALERMGGVAEFRAPEHPRAGELVLVAEPGAWFAYPWWTDAREAPDYAGHVDIHNKPGYDPCELFFGWPPPSVSRDPRRVRGTHGRVGPGAETVWTATVAEEFEPLEASLVGLARMVAQWPGWDVEIEPDAEV